MSLTSHLKNLNSPVRAYLDNISPWLANHGSSSNVPSVEMHNLGLGELAKVSLLVPPPAGSDTARTGTAIDFRVRVALNRFNPRDSAAASGVNAIPLYVGTMENGQHRARVLTESFDAAINILATTTDESEIDRACILLAHCEQVFRAGTAAVGESLANALDAATSGLDFAMSLDSMALKDLRALMTANSHQIDQWRQAIDMGERFDLNPSFSGSKLVGGADADWMVGDTLIDSKSYKELTTSKLRDFLRQLLGYAMLDLDDSLGIRTVGLWLPRQGITPTWSLDVLLGGNADDLLPTLRSGFRAATNNRQIAPVVRATQRRKDQILAGNRHTPQAMLVALALYEDKDIRFRVGRNTATPVAVIRALAKDRYARVREGVACNEQAPADVLASLSRDKSSGVRGAVFTNPSAPKQGFKAIVAAHEKSERSESREQKESIGTLEVSDDANRPSNQVRGNDGLNTTWFAEFLYAARRRQRGDLSATIPMPGGIRPWIRSLGRSRDFPDWWKAGLPNSVWNDLMQEHRPAWVRRAIASDLPISAPIVRDMLLNDVDPEIRWVTLKRSVNWPDDALGEFLGNLALDRKARKSFRTECSGLSEKAEYRPQTGYDRQTLALVAAHPSTPKSALHELTASRNHEILIALMENNQLLPEDLEALVSRLLAIRSLETRIRLATSARIPEALTSVLLKDGNPEVRTALARNETILDRILQELALDPELDVRLAVARNSAASKELAQSILQPVFDSGTDLEVLRALSLADMRTDVQLEPEVISVALDRLAKSGKREPNLRQIVASDERAMPQTLARLARSTDGLVRGSVASNPNASVETVAQLACDSDASVRACAADNRYLTENLLVGLAKDEASEVRAKVASSCRTSPEVLAVLADDESRLVRIAVVNNPNLSLSLLTGRAHDNEPAVRAQVATKVQLSSDVLALLLRDDDRTVRSAAYNNPSTRNEDKEELDAEQDRAWRASAPKRADLEEMVANNDSEIRIQVALDSRTPPDILLMLGGERRSVRVRRAVASNPNSSAQILNSLATDADAEVRQSVAFNVSTPDEVLRELADRSIDLAILVALNPGVTTGTLDILSKDSDHLARFVAKSVRFERFALVEAKQGSNPPSSNQISF